MNNNLSLIVNNKRNNVPTNLNDLIECDRLRASQLEQLLEEMKKEKKIAEVHQYTISERKGKWITYVKDNTKKHNRRAITSKDKKGLIEKLYNIYFSKEENPTFYDLYCEFVYNKVRRGDWQLQTQQRYERDYKQNLQDFGKIHIKDITEYDIEEFILDCIAFNKLTSKGFSNLRTIMYGVFHLARKKKYVDFRIKEVFEDMDIPKNKFTKHKKSDYELAYPSDERKKYMDYLKANLDDVRNQVIYLAFITGLRPAELVALKREDIDLVNNIVKVRRAEQRFKNKDGKDIYYVGNVKTENSNRDVFVSESERDYLRFIKFNDPFNEYLFNWKNDRIRVYHVDQKNETNCNQLGFIRRSVNKIRKTYASHLESKGISHEFICSQLGHSDYTTTQRFYIKDTFTIDEKKEMINKAS